MKVEITDRDGHVWADTIDFTVVLPLPEVRYLAHRVVADYRGTAPGTGLPREGAPS